MIQGIDVSHYQGEINWEMVAQSQVKFAYIKATDGHSVIDPMFYRNWNRAKAAGIPFGCYHFLRPGEIASQIQKFSQVLEVSEPPSRFLPPMVDVELACLSTEEVSSFLAAFPTAILYTDRAWITTRSYDSPLASNLLSRALWVAEYGVSAPTSTPWSRWAFWQYSTGRSLGVSTRVDLDWFNGTEAELLSLQSDNLTRLAK